MDNDTETFDCEESKWTKYGPFIFWGTLVGLPTMNLTAAIFNYKSLKLQVELERMRKISGRVQ